MNIIYSRDWVPFIKITRNSSNEYTFFYNENLPYKSRFSNRKLLHKKQKWISVHKVLLHLSLLEFSWISQYLIKSTNPNVHPWLCQVRWWKTPSLLFQQSSIQTTRVETIEKLLYVSKLPIDEEILTNHRLIRINIFFSTGLLHKKT